MPTSNRIILTDVDGVLLEWEKHFTEWMLQRSYYNENNEPDALGYSHMIALLTNAIKELKQENDDLKARVSALEK